MPVEGVRGYLQAGEIPQEILEAFPSLPVDDVKAVEAQLTSVAQTRFVLDEDVAIYADDSNAVLVTHRVATRGDRRSMAIRGSS